MKRRFWLSLICAITALLAAAMAFDNFSLPNNYGVVEAAPGKVTQGALQALGSQRLHLNAGAF
ncbi:MAG TPA: hypothetical protein VFY40_00465 [Blastocatellia bacterium]|nr:hypothetical protein [Blastocatellia bacterium]